MNLPFPAVPILLATALSAQGTAIFPSDHGTLPIGANLAGQFPYSSGISRIQCVYDGWDLGVPIGHQITQIGVRQHGGATSTGCTLQLEVRIAETTYTSDTLTTSYDTNFTTPPTTVFGPAPFTLPNLDPSTFGQQIWLPLTTPYTYHGGNLLVEWRITANSLGGGMFFYYLDAASFSSPVGQGQPGCPDSQNHVSQLISTPTVIGSNWTLDLWYAPANALGFLILQCNAPLLPPYPLGALAPGISPLCTGQVSLPQSFGAIPYVTTPGGNLRWNFWVPFDRAAWGGMQWSQQAVTVDFNAPGNVVVSNGDSIRFGTPPANTILYLSGSATPSTGLLWRNIGLITLFQWQ